ncbi:MAG: PspC domain-containing protein [Nocardiopsaceae bacterium]|nr:PspC domain-containing protein [Nocardiopsaceae bacterium]
MEEMPLQTQPDAPSWLPPTGRPGRRAAQRRARWEQRHNHQGRHHGRWDRRRWPGGPLRRDMDNRLAGGLVAGIAAKTGRGDHVTAFRVVLAFITLISGGWTIPIYMLGWLLVPAGDTGENIGGRARHDSRGIALALGLMSLLAVILLLLGTVNTGPLESWGWNQLISVGCLALIWRNASPGEQETMRRLIEPLGGVSASGGDVKGTTKGTSTTKRITVLRIVLGIAALGGGLGSLLTARESLALLRPLGGVVAVAAGLVLLLGPWWFRIARDLVLERQARARAEERAEVAARVHDSVLQTLALIQRRSDDPAAVVALARAQERELRSWLFEGRAPGSAVSSTLAGGIREIQQDAESRHGVPVEVVTVGDRPLSPDVEALLAAAREAVVNAAKWSGAPVISLFAEADAEMVEIVVRDRGKGFDPDAVQADRKGLAESVRGRMARHGGTAAVQSAPGEGTKVTLTIPGPGPAGDGAGRARKGDG